MALFDNFASDYDSFFNTSLGRAVLETEKNLIMKMISPEAGLSALDAGCGTGVFSEFLVRAGMDVTGFDESPEMLGIASKKKSLKTVRMVRGDINKLPFDSDCFDRVLCAFVIEFIPDAKQVISELKRVLKPGGILVVATLNSDGAWAQSRKDDEFWNNATFRNEKALKEIGLEDAEFEQCLFFPPNTKRFFKLADWSARIKNVPGAVVFSRWEK